MMVKCFICEEEFEITLDEAIEYHEEITKNEMVCPECAAIIIEYSVQRN